MSTSVRLFSLFFFFCFPSFLKVFQAYIYRERERKSNTKNVQSKKIRESQLGMHRARAQTGILGLAILGLGCSRARLFSGSVIPGLGHSRARSFSGSVILGLGYSRARSFSGSVIPGVENLCQ